MPSQPTKSGLWEEGKRIEWFDSDQQGEILSNKLDYKMYFRKTESGFNVDSFASFEVPDKFEDRVNAIKDKFKK